MKSFHETFKRGFFFSGLLLVLSGAIAQKSSSVSGSHSSAESPLRKLPQICKNYEKILMKASPALEAIFSIQCAKNIDAKKVEAVRIKEIWSKILKGDWSTLPYGDKNFSKDLTSILEAEALYLSSEKNPPIKTLLKSLDEAIASKTVNFEDDKPPQALGALVGVMSCSQNEGYYEYLSAAVTESFEAKPYEVFQNFVELEKKRGKGQGCPLGSYMTSLSSLINGGWGDGYVVASEVAKRKMVLDKVLPKIFLIQASIKSDAKMSPEKKNALIEGLGALQEDWLIYYPVVKK